MSVFVNYGGPKLDRKQKQLVRSQAMVSFRGKQKQEKNKDATVLTMNQRRLAPAANQTDSSSTEDLDDMIDQHHQQAEPRANVDNGGQNAQRPDRPAPNTGRKRHSAALVPSAHPHRNWQQQHRHLYNTNLNSNPYDMRGAPPKSTHMTGVDARTFKDYLGRCGSYSSYLDEAFVLVGFRQPSYFRPDMSKAACIYIGWLLTAGVLDAFKGGKEISYPWYEWQAVSELQRFIDGADRRELHEVVYPVVVLGMFEMVRFSPRTITHLAAVERFVKTRGGLGKMPIVMQHLVVMGDTLESVCLHTPLAFSTLDATPTFHFTTPPGHPFYQQGQFRSSPLLVCDDKRADFSRAAASGIMTASPPGVGKQVAAVLQEAHTIFRRFSGSALASEEEHVDAGTNTAAANTVPVDLDSIIDSYNDGRRNDVARLLLETCALAARIMKRTLEDDMLTTPEFESPGNERDVLAVYDNVRFMGLGAWEGLPYVYVWVNLIGFASSKDMRIKSYFMAEVVRCAFSYGCYQMEVFQGVLKNFLILRGAIEARRVTLDLLIDV